MKDFQTRDFQNALKLIIEGDDGMPTGDAGSADAGSTKPGASIESSQTPSEAYLAYKREFAGFWGSLKNTLLQANKTLEGIGSHIDDFTSDALPLNKIRDTVKAAYSPGARPVVDRSAISAMSARARAAAGPKTPANPAATASTPPTT